MELKKKAAMEPERSLFLDKIPFTVLQSILFRLDLRSMCAASASCRLLKSAFDQVLPFVQNLHFEDVLLRRRGLERLLSRNTSLQSLTLNCSKLTAKAAVFLVKPRLQDLQVYNCEKISPKLISRLGACRDLRRLSVDPCSDRAKLTSLRDCQFLERLSLTFTGDLRSANLALPSLKLLKVLEIGGISEASALEFIKLGEASSSGDSPSPGLQRLSLVLLSLSDVIVRKISGSLTSLLELELQDEASCSSVNSDLTNAGIQSLGTLPELRRLSLVRRPGVFQRVNDLGIFMVICTLQQLQSIRLGGFCRITDASCATILQSCPKLHTFELIQTNQLTDLAFHNLSSTPLALVTVNLASNALISDDTARHLALCKTIEVLNLKGCSSIGDNGLRAISGLRRVKTLLLDGSDVSDFGLYSLADGTMPLAWLSLRGCSRVTDDGIVALMSQEAAKGLESLDLSQIPKLTDESVEALVRNQVQVTELWLRDCCLIGDKSVMALATMQRTRGALKLLDLWNCRKISKNSMGWLKKPHFVGLRRLGLPLALTQMLRLISQERPFMVVHCRGYELGRRGEEEQNWLQKSRRSEEEDELERWIDDDDYSD